MWWREGEHWSSLTWARRRIHFVVVRGGSLCPRALVVRGGSLSWVGIVVVCWWGVIRVRLRDALVVALVARRGLSVVVGVRVGGGSSLPVGACCSWVRGWGIVVVGRVSPSVGGSLSVCACGRCWWWCSSPVVAVEQQWWWLLFVVVVVVKRLWLSLSGGRRR